MVAWLREVTFHMLANAIERGEHRRRVPEREQRAGRARQPRREREEGGVLARHRAAVAQPDREDREQDQGGDPPAERVGEPRGDRRRRARSSSMSAGICAGGPSPA